MLSQNELCHLDRSEKGRLMFSFNEIKFELISFWSVVRGGAQLAQS